MKLFRPVLTAGAFAGALAACAASPAQPTPEAEAEALYVRHVMQERINPAILAIWDIGNNAMDEAGGIDPALMDDAKWSSLNNAASSLAAASRDMAAAQVIRAAQAGNLETAEGEVSMAAVQRLIDADPGGFRQLAAEQSAHAGRLASAAAARDAATAGELVAGMDGVCESCHARYWYAQQ